MNKELEKYIDARYAEYEKYWAENPLPPYVPVVDTERKKIPVRYDVPDSTYDLEVKSGHTTYEVVGHFNPDARENFLQKILRMVKEEKSLQ